MSPLRVLLAEESLEEAERIERALVASGFTVALERLDGAPELQAALARADWDVVLASFTLSRLDGLEALRVVQRSRQPHVPFLVLTAGLAELQLVQALKAGAAGFASKQQLERLGPIIQQLRLEATGPHQSNLHNTAELLRQSEERLRLLVESVRDYGIYMLDPTGVITTWNSGAQHIKGYRADEVIGRHFSIFYPPEDAAAGRPERELQIASAEGRYEEEGWRLRKNGERFWANVVITAVHDGARGLRGFAKVTQDLTQRRLAEQKSRQAAEAENAVRSRDEFISVAAHELRTPLTALQLKLQGVDQVLKKGPHEPGAGQTARLHERVTGALRQIDRLSELVERLLDVSRIVKGSLVNKLEQADLTALVGRVVEDFRDSALQAGSELSFRPVGSVTGVWDTTRIEQAITNLLSNAIKYGAGTPIELQLEPTGAGARLTVSDRGIGIAAEDLDRIFARFERAASARHYGGLGLGLYVTRNIVEAHGGTIKVASTAGQGATFTIELPSQAVLPEPAGAGS